MRLPLRRFELVSEPDRAAQGRDGADAVGAGAELVAVQAFARRVEARHERDVTREAVVQAERGAESDARAVPCATREARGRHGDGGRLLAGAERVEMLERE